MRVAVVDIGTNSTRMLVADVDRAGHLRELDRRTEVTRLGEGVDASGTLSSSAMARVTKAIDGYAQAIDELAADARIAVLTSAVRDSSNGEQFVASLRERYGLEARIISGEEEAQLTFLGAMSDRGAARPTLVVDVGGGSTELVVGALGVVSFHVSLQVGVVRQTERHLHGDPPSPGELLALRRDVRTLIERDVPEAERRGVERAIAVAGTATSLAAIDQALAPYDRELVHGYRLDIVTTRLLLSRLAAMPLAERRETRGLHPDRAPTIVAGTMILIEVLDAFGLDGFEVSENDILRGAALRRAGVASTA
ncbi:MAG TPA: Ppx/GppA phosphatase family protein [Solirubrobacteraceae bacterium]|jgi:exopolyphosphatase/guanosine-5'-triphosphate,3'-diphosphate pyrophosphatase|nr:Ppx/GppA phosphatase family protein [Solirubrobacteraceae bacterium]